MHERLSAGEDGDKKYILIKSPNKQVFCDAPLSTFEEEDDGDMAAIGNDTRDDDYEE
jgi:hypothetical protein